MTFKPKAIFIVPAHYDALEQKGVLNMLSQREENDYFLEIHTIHMQAPETRKINFSPVQTIYEFKSHTPSASRALTAVRYLKHLLFIFFEVRKIAKDKNIDFIRAQDPYFSALIACMVARACRIPFCISVHSDYEQRHKLDPEHGSPKIFGSRGLAKKLELFTYKRADMILPIRKSLQKSIESLGVKNQNFRVFPHAVDLNPFEKPLEIDFHDRFKIDRSKKIISFIGRIANENYIDDYLKLAEKFANHDNIVLVLAGGGEEEDRVKSIVGGDPHLKDFIHLPGFLKKEDVISLRCQSYVNIAFMGGMSLIEACAAKRPVISYDVEWHYELVKNDETGYLIDEHDVEQVYKSLKFLLENPKMADEFGAQAKKLAFQRHNFDTVSPVRQGIYDELIEMRS